MSQVAETSSSEWLRQNVTADCSVITDYINTQFKDSERYQTPRTNNMTEFGALSTHSRFDPCPCIHQPAIESLQQNRVQSLIILLLHRTFCNQFFIILAIIPAQSLDAHWGGTCSNPSRNLVVMMTKDGFTFKSSHPVYSAIKWLSSPGRDSLDLEDEEHIMSIPPRHKNPQERGPQQRYKETLNKMWIGRGLRPYLAI